MTVPRYEPMLATPWPAAFDDPAWQFEPKWDGVRAILSWDGSACVVRSRSGTDITGRYPEVARIDPPRPCVLDGEIVAFDTEGRPSFERLQRRVHLEGPARVASTAGTTPVTFVAFDLLYDEGSLVSLPLRERRARLEETGGELTITPAEVGSGLALWAAVVERDLEGIVAKRLDSPYRPGVRSPDWRKIANVVRLRAVVGGFTPGEGGRSATFGALLLGLWDGYALRFIGSVGTGFSDADLAAIRAALDEMVRADPPFAERDLPAGAVWVEPVLVAAVGFREWTTAGRVRQPRFLGFTGDPAEAVTWETEHGGRLGDPAG